MSDTLDRLREMVSRDKRAIYDVGDWWNVADAAIEEMKQQARARALLEQEIERLRVDADRYIWLLAHMGSVERHAAQWRPERHKPLLRYVQDFIDAELPKAGKGWVARQRALLAVGGART